MRKRALLLSWICFSFSILFPIKPTAAILYVDSQSTAPHSPYADWSTAAATVQDAIEAANAGDTILVTNGVYATGGRAMKGSLTNRIALYKPVTVQSVNGPFVTTIRGSGFMNGSRPVRCAWLTNGAALKGFTVRDGATDFDPFDVDLIYGGGVWCASSNALVSNCILMSNTATYYGGGAFRGTFKNCLVISNTALPTASIGVAGVANCVLNNCTVMGNMGIGAFGMLTNCIIYSNSSNYIWSTCSHCCTTPLPAGDGNFTNAPELFVDGIQLTANSPCRGAGTNIGGATDFFGQPWSNPPSVGCAERQSTPLVTQPQLRITSSPAGFAVAAMISQEAGTTCWWIKDGLPLVEDRHFTGTQTTNLAVIGIKPLDAGNYQLVVQNNYGAVTSSVAPLTLHFVDISTVAPIPPFVTWSSAATNIQDAIDVTEPGGIVLVADGTYASGGKAMQDGLTNRVTLDKPLLVMSMNGSGASIIEGAWDPVTTNGPMAIRCAWLTNDAVLSGFTLRKGASGTGIYSQSGGGAWCSSTSAVIANCQFTNNRAAYKGGGAAFGTLRSCLLVGNGASDGGGGAYGSTLNNCTVVSNFCRSIEGGGGTSGGTAFNSIVLGNYGTFEYVDNYQVHPDYDVYTRPYEFCCTQPLLTNTGDTNVDPQFLDLFHISTTSPCRGAGNPAYASGLDLEGKPWTNPPSMGCVEVAESELTGPISVALLTVPTNTFINRWSFFTAVLNGHVSRLDWSFGGDSPTNEGFETSHRWTSVGDFPVLVTAYNTDNPGGVSASSTVHVEPLYSPLIESAEMNAGRFQFRFNTQTNAQYFVEFTTNLAPPSWSLLDVIVATNTQFQFLDVAPTNAARFYRIRVF